MSKRFDFQSSTWSVLPDFGYIDMTSHVYFDMPEETTPEDMSTDWGFAMRFSKYSREDTFELSDICSIYWNDCLGIPKECLAYLYEHLDELIQQAEYDWKHNAIRKPRERAGT